MSQTNETALNAERLQQAMAWSLKEGGHEENDDGDLCVMEAVAYVAGEPWSDSPACACPILSTFMRSWNDGLPNDEDRDRLLKPYIAKLVGTKSTPEVEQRRGWMALDWLIRVHTPKWLEQVPALQPYAKELRVLDEITDEAGLVAATGKLNPARKAASAARAAAWAAAWDAAWAAARDAARAAAWDAAWAAAWDAARDAAWAAARDAAWAAAWDAARDAARAAAWAAARAAAWAAARDAARDALKPTTEWLQVSALDLLDRMIEVRS